MSEAVLFQQKELRINTDQNKLQILNSNAALGWSLSLSSLALEVKNITQNYKVRAENSSQKEKKKKKTHTAASVIN